MKQLFGKIKNKLAQDKISIGLDIGTDSIKVIKLKSNKDVIELLAWSTVSVCADVSGQLMKIFPEIEVKLVNIGFSGPSTIIRYTNMPKMSEAELKLALKFEAQKHIPFSLNDVYIDSAILKDDLPDNKMLVLIAAAKKEFVDQLIKQVGDAQVKVDVAELDSLALANAFNFNYNVEKDLPHKTIALLNIGATTSNLCIIDNGIPRLSRDVHIAGSNITQKLMDSLNLDFKAAEQLKLKPEPEQLDKVVTAVESILANLALEVRASFDYFETQCSSTVAKIYLSGGGSSFGGLPEMLGNLLGIEIEVWDPLRRILLPQDNELLKNLKEFPAKYAVAVGLALRQ